MNEISIGAVGAALIAGLVSLLGLVIGKEQKVSEFRQAWIDELRKCLVAYLVSINAISDALRLKRSGKAIDDKLLLEAYKSLNEANHGIQLRINSDEEPAKELLAAMSDFEGLSKSDSDLSPINMIGIEQRFLVSSKSLLKFEWKRVKRGEEIFVWTKRIIGAAIAISVLILAYAWITDDRTESKLELSIPKFQLLGIV